MKAILLALLLASLAAAQTKPIPVIFDTDIGDDIDDALALALALQSPELDVKLVTTVADNVESRTRLAWKELGVFGRQDVALATGAPEPLLDRQLPDLAAQFRLLTPQDQPPPAARERAARRIIDTLLASDVKMTIIPVGPLTNIALALREEPAIKGKIERIVLMGGAYYPPRREYNIYRDRIAAAIVFRSGVPITAVGLDVTEKCKMQPADVERIKNAKSPSAQFLYKLIQLWQKDKQDQMPTLHDPLAVAAALRASLIETSAVSVDVDVASPETGGTTTVRADPLSATRVARSVNTREFLDLFLERVTAPPRGN
jgi:inosine-uridine nucleoside N-ribohydrolase